MDGLNLLKTAAEDLKVEDDEVEQLFQMFVFLYADDTVILSDSVEGLQRGLNAMSAYCKSWKLRVNVTKTKVVVFSRGKIRKLPEIFYEGKQLEIVYDFLYLGLNLNYNNKFNLAQKRAYDRASRAMFCLLKRCRKLSLPLDIQVELFEKMISPILLYGSELWGYEKCELANKLQLRFYKLLLGLKKSTPSCMILGELGS